MWVPSSRAPILGGSWVVISGVIGPVIWVISIVILFIVPLITTHGPPSIELRRPGLACLGCNIGAFIIS